MSGPRAAVVVGAGIGGCAAALALRRAGVEVEVRERYDRSTEDPGAFLTLSTSGVVALRELGCLEAVDEQAAVLDTFRAQSADGEVLVERPLGDGGDRYRLVTRAALCDALRERTAAAGIRVRFGAAVDDDVGADLLVAADGLRSTWRERVNPDDAPPRYTGQRVYYGWSPWVHPSGRVGAFHPVDVPDAAFGHIPDDGGTWWFARVTAPPLPREELSSPPFPLLAERLDGLALEIARRHGTMRAVNAYDLPFVSSWSAGRTVLLGDAAHAASPATGQGASTALEDGIVLGKAVAQHGRLDDAVAAYEAARRGRTQANIVASAGHATPDSPLARAAPGRAMSADELRVQLDWATPLAAHP